MRLLHPRGHWNHESHAPLPECLRELSDDPTGKGISHHKRLPLDLVVQPDRFLAIPRQNGDGLDIATCTLARISPSEFYLHFFMNLM